jgi:hypothetical protein
VRFLIFLARWNPIDNHPDGYRRIGSAVLVVKSVRPEQTWQGKIWGDVHLLYRGI